MSTRSTAQPSTSTSSSTRHFEVDPSLLGVGVGKDVPIDPALFAIEQVVNDVSKGKIKLEEQEPQRQVHQVDEQSSSAQNASGLDTGPIDIMDEEFDPALREIVNSLTNAQSTNSLGANLTQAQAQAAIDAHLSEEIDHGMAFKTLEDLERAGFGMISDQFASSNDNFLLPDATQQTTPGGSSSHFPAGSSTDPSGPRRRGRPKGSKNKPKPGIPGPPPPPPVPKPAKKRGRPPKKRTEEELAELERQKYNKEHGLQKQRGRPRKFPGYLVREMRLKKNRAEFQDLLRRHGESERMDVERDQGHDHENGSGAFWTDGMEQSILAAVEGLEAPSRTHQDMDMDMTLDQAGGEGGEEDMPSSRAFEGGGDEMEMRRVFGLPADTEQDDDGQ